LDESDSLENILEKVRISTLWLRELTRARFLNRETFLKADIFSIPLFRELGRRLSLETDEVKFLKPEEVKEALLRKKQILFKTIKNRLMATVFLFSKGKAVVFDGKKALLFISKVSKKEDYENLGEIKGFIAYPGKVKGKVVIVNEKSDIHKMNEGDVLLSRMTTPQLMPAIYEAKGIITDEGGITCHAAIVAREMKKPCIIGTKIATRVLKDGDEVEVDANIGVVKIIKRA
jgi:pyruvate,water dikinase